MKKSKRKIHKFWKLSIVLASVLTLLMVIALPISVCIYKSQEASFALFIIALILIITWFSIFCYDFKNIHGFFESSYENSKEHKIKSLKEEQ